MTGPDCGGVHEDPANLTVVGVDEHGSTFLVCDHCGDEVVIHDDDTLVEVDPGPVS